VASVAHPTPPQGVPVPVYVAGVVAVTLALIGAAAWLRPGLRTDLALLSGLHKPVVAAPGSFYSVRVAPILDAHCTGCHGATRSKGALRLDGFGNLALGGRHGPVVVAGDPAASTLLNRVLLPPDDPRAMPPKGKAPLAADEITVLRLWIGRGASPSLPAAAVKGAPPLPKVVAFPDFDPARVARMRAPAAPAVEALQRRFPGAVGYVARGSADVTINASLVGSRFGDAELALFDPLRDHVVALDASRTAITDASAARLAAMPRLQTLRLNGTQVSGSTAAALAGARSLRSLSVVATRIRPGDLAAFRDRGVRLHATAD
jgi:hypothetical protein